MYITTKPEKILYVWDYVEWGGAQIHWIALMREAAKHRPVLAILPERSDPQLINILKSNSITYEFFPRFRNIGPAFSLREKLVRHRDKFFSEYRLLVFLRKYDLRNSVLHIDLAPWNSVLLLCLLCYMSGQVFMTMHNRILTESSWRRFIWRLKLRLISRFDNFHVLASNNDAKEHLREIASPELVDDIKVTYTSVNPAEIDEVLEEPLDRAAFRQQFQLAPDKLTVLGVGQFVERKGRWVFLDSARELIDSGMDIQFAWVSNVKSIKSDLERVAAYGLGDRFRLITSDEFGGGRRDVLRMYRLGDIFLLPSFIEGLPIALLEAMAMKLASISTNINGIPEAIIDHETGLLVEPGDVKGVSAAISELVKDSDLRAKLGDNGRAMVLEKFDEREAAKIAWQSYVAAFAGVEPNDETPNGK